GRAGGEEGRRTGQGRAVLNIAAHMAEPSGGRCHVEHAVRRDDAQASGPASGRRSVGKVLAPPARRVITDDPHASEPLSHGSTSYRFTASMSTTAPMPGAVGGSM